MNILKPVCVRKRGKVPAAKLRGMVALVPVKRKGGWAWTSIDATCVFEVAKYRWYLSAGYATRALPVATHGYNKYMQLHRMLTKARKGKVVDHINGDRLDNRLINLRVGTHADNSHNIRNLRKKTNTGLRGIRKNPNGRYTAWITVADKSINLKTHDTLAEAKAARLAGEQKYWGK